MDMIKVSATSRTSAVAGAIAGVVREHHRAEVQAIGAGAVNQAVKALVLATGYLKGDGINVSCVPEFADVTIDDKVRTAIKLVVDPVKLFASQGKRAGWEKAKRAGNRHGRDLWRRGGPDGRRLAPDRPQHGQSREGTRLPGGR